MDYCNCPIASEFTGGHTHMLKTLPMHLCEIKHQ